MDTEIKDKLIEIQTDQTEIQQMLGDIRADIDHIGDMVSETQSEKYENLFFVAGFTFVAFYLIFKIK